MEDSSETGWKKTDSPRRSNTNVPSDRSLGLLHPSRISSLADTSRDFVFGTVRNLGDNARKAPSEHLRHRVLFSDVSESEVALDRFPCGLRRSNVSLRQWLDDPDRTVDAIECLHIFRQIVKIVNTAHSWGIVVNNVRPSCFVRSPFNHISFVEPGSCSSSGIISLEDRLKSQNKETSMSHDLLECRSRIDHETNAPFAEERENSKKPDGENESVPMENLLLMETSWYTSPEEIANAPSSCSSDVYRLGVLLFELFCTFSSTEEKTRTMSSLRHRVLPPQLLLKWPKEASFCLLLLLPDPSSRPKMGELLQTEFLNEPRNYIEDREASIDLGNTIQEQELLLEFLVLVQRSKQEAADILHDTISLVSSDIEDIVNKQKTHKKKVVSLSEHDEDHHSMLNFPLLNNAGLEGPTSFKPRKPVRPQLKTHNVINSDYYPSESHILGMNMDNHESFHLQNSRLMKNFKKLESAYLLTRRRLVKPSVKPFGHSLMSSNSRGSVLSTERSVNNSLSTKGFGTHGESGWVSPFLEDLCKYLSFTELRVKADLKQGNLLNSSNLVCSVSFDRDREFFAAAGVNKMIKVFECDAILNKDCDMHYPITEMNSRSKLSSVCWNGYIKSQIASSNFEGVVQVWDATKNQVFLELKEHERRVWAVDFSLADPMILVSGSDDGSVKLWSINQEASIGTIKTKANVCCVQFPSDTGRSLAFGSADHRVYYYDLRNPKLPLCTLIGHDKTVSYVKFVDSMNLVSASTDGTLKLWDLSICASRVLDSPLRSFTGHTNVKNFVGLSISDGYIATGSETNEVFIYHKAFPMPALSFKFGSVDPLSGNKTDDPAQFVSSLCWRGDSTTLVAANSAGDIKLLEMV
ncbi:hypothetical protein Nepgr_016179 [Nepenthes gracilis]|uniref:Protein kinase domain-containing protein n=1 Tax=Nepenthes gracilis TaxID=150966 RepID=A0AAD3XRD4_NEPGR|nr:hypothetical protein Nepgr_016179 [Nepenthes gracilis]